MFALRQARGFTVIDVLVAALLLATCMIGIAALKAERVRNNNIDLDHAATLALELINLITTKSLSDIRYESTIGVTCDKTNLNVTTNASDNMPKDQAWAAQQVACWQDKVATLLPNGTASVLWDADAPIPTYVITISWSNPGTHTASYVRRVMLPDAVHAAS